MKRFVIWVVALVMILALPLRVAANLEGGDPLSINQDIETHGSNMDSLPEDVREIIAAIDALPEPETADIDSIEAKKEEIISLYMSLDQLSPGEAKLVGNRDKLNGLLKFVLHPIEGEGALTREVESIINTGPVPFSTIGQVTAQNIYVLSYVLQRYENGDAVASAISATVHPEVAAKAWEVIGNKTSKPDRAQAIYNWVASNVYYDYDYYSHGNPRPGDSAISVLQTGIAVCEGYTNLLRDMLNSVGVPCLYASGAAINFPLSWNGSNYNVSNHAWNIINTGSGWFYADSTWDSRNYYEYGVKHGPYTPRSNYYNPAMAYFSGDHNTLGVERVAIGDGASVNSGLVYRDGKYYFYLYQSGMQLYNRYIVLKDNTVAYATYPLLDVQYPGVMMYFGSDGAAVSGWHTYNAQQKYYFDPTLDCQATAGWLTLSGKNYYFSPTTAVMHTGWLQLDGKRHYFVSNGVMATGTIQINGITNRFDSNGVWLGEGEVQNGWQEENGVRRYYINGQPAWGWQTVDSKLRYFDNGIPLYGIYFVEGYYRYFEPDGVVPEPGFYAWDGYYRCVGDGGILKPAGFHNFKGAWRVVLDWGILAPAGIHAISGAYRCVANEGLLLPAGVHYVKGAWRGVLDGGVLAPENIYFLAGNYRYVGNEGLLKPAGVYIIKGAWRGLVDGSILPPQGVYKIAGYNRYILDGGVLAPAGWYTINSVSTYVGDGAIVAQQIPA